MVADEANSSSNSNTRSAFTPAVGNAPPSDPKSCQRIGSKNTLRIAANTFALTPAVGNAPPSEPKSCQRIGSKNTLRIAANTSALTPASGNALPSEPKSCQRLRIRKHPRSPFH